jgi:uncharacterized OB-fold protein
MNKFETELKAGNFVTSECIKCNKIIWPPSDYCDNCFNDVNWRKVSPNGKLIEWSKKIMIYYASQNLKIQYVLWEN